MFHVIDNRAKVFKRRIISNADNENFTKPTYTAVKRIEAPTIHASSKTMHDYPDAVIQALSPDSILIDENMDVIRIYGDMADYTQLSAGAASMNLMSLAKKEFKQELRALVYKVLREDTEITILPKKLKIRNAYHQINIIIRPLRIKNASEPLLLVSFEKVKELKKTPKKSDRTSDDAPIIEELEQELASTREHLQTVVEELETSNEELQSTNEELQSSNEELQSSNEELETANEELQSTNEELLTVNDELQIKTHELTSSHENLSNVKESIDFPMVAVSTDLKIKLHNNAAREIFMMENDETTEAITSVGTKIDIPDLRKNILSVIKNGRTFYRQIDTEDVCYLERIIPYKDNDNIIDGAILTYIDNTDTRQIENKLRESEERYQLSVDGSSVGLWDWHIDHNNLYCSPKLLTLLNVSKKDFRSNFSFFEDRIHPDDREDVLAILNAHLEKGFDFNVECRMQRSSLSKPLKNKAKDYIWTHIRGQATWDQNQKAVRMSGSLNDVTERRIMIDQLRDSNEALGRFAYVCSHDLREPARIANNFSALLSDMYSEKLDEDGREYVHHIKESTGRMQDMIKDMLSYAQIENKSTSLEDVDCNTEIKKVVENLKLNIQEKNAQITYSDLPKIKGDRMQIFQLMQNLIGNGLKFSTTQTPKVHIDAEEKDDMWHFSVKDNGIGMKKEHTRQIFDVFQRLHNTEDYPGTGIGLSICQKIVHRHSGEIWVESKPGKGSTFHFSIPKKLLKRQANNRVKLHRAG